MATVLSDEEIRANLAANLQRLLADRGWTQLELCKRTGEQSGTISRACKGLHMPGGGILYRIAEALDVSIDRLLQPAAEAPAKILEKSA